MAQDKTLPLRRPDLKQTKPSAKPQAKERAGSSGASPSSNEDEIGTFDDLLDLDPKQVKRITFEPHLPGEKKALTRKIQ